VLIVDDDEDSRELSAWCLLTAGWSVYACANGAAALLTVPHIEPDVIMMDLRMPVLGGLDAIRQLKQHEATRHVPIVACSAFDQGWSEVKARDAGCDEFVAKPFEPEALPNLLEAVIARGRVSSR
jgi:two-component system cell cycle response regulator DivK